VESMNRETKRRLQRQGEVGPDGAPAFKERPQSRRTPKPASQRTKPLAFVREVRGELRKVSWPTRAEVTNYSTVVFISLLFVITLIFLLDLGFAKSVLFLFDT
jgi:preprotein translocase subunit SecE